MEFIKLLLNEENVRMQYEIAAMLLLLMLSAIKAENRKRLAFLWAGIFLFFIYIHRALFPFVISGAYFFLLAGILDSIIFLDIKSIIRPFRLFCKRLYGMLQKSLLPCTAIIVLILLIQLCRMNICIDYDSLRYGLRSDVLLSGNGIRGFFENTGLVNIVYTYPKGFELITLPLNFGHTYGYVLCFNIWIFIAVIMLAGEAAKVLGADTGMRAFTFTAMLTALVPGISNMSVTAKSDLSTLLCQLVFILCVVKYFSENDTVQGTAHRALSGIGAGALILSFSFKPTAVVFSSLIGLCAILFFAVKKKHIYINAAGVRALLMMSVFTLIIMLRTFLISGQPVTSVFSGLFAKLGMTLNYPFMEQNLAGNAAVESFTEGIKFFLSRVLHFMFCPTGVDMEHVIMAWGGIIFIIMLIAALLLRSRTLKNIKALRLLNELKTSEVSCTLEEGCVDAYSFIMMCLYAVIAVSLISLWMLYQVDGNYFELLYLISVIAGGTAISVQLSVEGSELGIKEKRIFGGSSGIGLIAVTAVSVYLTALTGWNGAVGFTPAKLVNRGYYNHEIETGIKNPLGWDKHVRVAAFAKEPDCYRLKGRVESYVDITGSCGNIYLVKNLNMFKEYLSFADIDYIYADLDYLANTEDSAVIRAAELFRDLIYDGDFEEIVLEENSSTLLYCRIDKERVAVSWETPMPEALKERTKKQEMFYRQLNE